jgi:prevent-host-death family protein
MKKRTRQALIDELSQACKADRPVTIKHKGKPIAVVLPVEDYQEFQAGREKKLEKLKAEMKGILTLIRSRTKHQLLEEVETELKALRQKIEQGME